MSNRSHVAAFPRPYSDERDQTMQYPAQIGMTLLEYFAAHAPEMPEWFTCPSLAGKPKKPGIFSSVFGPSSNHPHKDFIKKYYSDEGDCWVIPAETPADVDVVNSINEEIDQWSKDWENYNAALPHWVQSDHFNKLTTWRYAYARHMANASTLYKD